MGIEGGSWAQTQRREQGCVDPSPGFHEEQYRYHWCYPQPWGPSRGPCGPGPFSRPATALGVGSGQGCVASSRQAQAPYVTPGNAPVLGGRGAPQGSDCPHLRQPGACPEHPSWAHPSPAESHLGPGPGRCVLNRAKPWDHPPPALCREDPAGPGQVGGGPRSLSSCSAAPATSSGSSACCCARVRPLCWTWCGPRPSCCSPPARVSGAPGWGWAGPGGRPSGRRGAWGCQPSPPCRPPPHLEA